MKAMLNPKRYKVFKDEFPYTGQTLTFLQHFLLAGERKNGITRIYWVL